MNHDALYTPTSTVRSRQIPGGLKSLKQESIGQAGRRVVSVLGERQYFERDAKRFFSECYSMRSALVHGNEKRPAWEIVNVAASHLQMMVGDLLGRELLGVTDAVSQSVEVD